MRRFIDYGRYPTTFDDVDASNSAWMLTNPEVLLLKAPQFGSNTRLGGANGMLGRRTFDTERVVDLRWAMYGDVDPDGDVNSDREAGLAVNKRLFVASFFRAERDDFGCVAAVIEDLDGAVYMGGVQFDAPVWTTGLTECGVTMTTTIPRGELAEVGS